jgi:hypothetical protein
VELLYDWILAGSLGLNLLWMQRYRRGKLGSSTTYWHLLGSFILGLAMGPGTIITYISGIGEGE